MGRYSQTVAANSFGSEVHDLGSSKAHHVRISTTEDRGGAKGALGGVPSREEDRTCCVAVLVRARMGPGGDPTPDAYTINIPVSSSSIATCGGQDLSVV